MVDSVEKWHASIALPQMDDTFDISPAAMSGQLSIIEDIPELERYITFMLDKHLLVERTLAQYPGPPIDVSQVRVRL